MEQPQKRVKRIQSKTTRQISRVQLRQCISPPLSIPVLRTKGEIFRSDIPAMEFIGCFHNKVIVMYCHRLSCFVYFDQHAVHERIRYEFYIERLRSDLNCIAIGEQLQFNGIDPVVIEHRRGKIRKVIDKRRMLKEVEEQHQNMWGFTFEQQGNRTFLVESPSVMGMSLTDEQICETLSTMRKEIIPKSIDRIIASCSCKGAIKFNEQIDRNCAVQMIQTLARCQYPFFCVHGRDSIHIEPNRISELIN